MQQLADRAGVSPTTVMKLEHGEITIQLDKFLQILDQLSLPFSSLIVFEGEEPPWPSDPLIRNVAQNLSEQKLEDAIVLIAEELRRRAKK